MSSSRDAIQGLIPQEDFQLSSDKPVLQGLLDELKASSTEQTPGQISDESEVAENPTFAREFSQFAREFSQFAREFSQFAREPTFTDDQKVRSPASDEPGDY